MRCPNCDHDNLAGAELCSDCGLDLAGLDLRAWDVDPSDPRLRAPIAELDVEPPIALGPEASVLDAVTAMRAGNVGCAFVVDDVDGLIGIVTERDLTTRVAMPGRAAEATRLREVMTPRPVALNRRDPLAWALHRMGVDGHRHLAVVDDGRLVGLLSVSTVVRELLRA